MTEVGHWPVACGVREDNGAVARHGVEDGPRGRRELHRLRPGLRIGQQRAGAPYPLPLEAGDLRGPRAGEQQQPDRGGGLSVLGVVEDEAGSFQLVSGEEPLARLHPVALDVAAGVGALGPEVPRLGLAHHHREHGQGTVGVAGGAACGVEAAAHVSAGDVGDAHLSEEVREVAAQQVLVACAGGGLPAPPLRRTKSSAKSANCGPCSRSALVASMM